MTITDEELRELRRKAGLWDDLMFARAATAAAPNDSEWKRLAREGRTMEAIKVCRAKHGIGLLEAKDCVEGYAATGATP